MANIVGKWKIARSANFTEFLAANGATMERIDMALKVEQFSTTEFYMDGKTLGRRIYNADGTLLVDKWAVIGEEKDDVSMVDDSPAKTRVTVVDENTVVREETGANHSATSTIVFANGELHQTLTGNGVTCQRSFVRV